jgi:hypothetical protein
LFGAYHLVAVEQAEWIKSHFQLGMQIGVLVVCSMGIDEGCIFGFGGRMRTYVKTYPAHCINCSFTQLVLEVVSLDEANTVLSGHSALHLHSAFHHAVHDALGYTPLTVAEEDDRCRMLIRVE